MNPHSVPTAASAAAPKSHAVSTGPTSPDGKAKSSLNALKTGLTGRTVLLPTEDAAAYQQHVSDYEKDLRPAGQRECDLVQSIADPSWRLQRIPALESAIYAQGRIQFADQFNCQDPALRTTFIDLHTHLAYEKQLRNLQLQESRLHRRREKAHRAFGAPCARLRRSRRAPPGAIRSPQPRHQQSRIRLAPANRSQARQ